MPEGTSKEEVMQKAIAAGIATESDFGITAEQPKEKAKAAEDKAKYTLAKPAAVGKKDSAIEAAMAARSRKRQDNAIGDMFEQPTLEDTGYKPRWQN